MGCCDTERGFTMIEVGFPGRNSYGGVFRVSKLRCQIKGNNFNFSATIR